MRSVRLQDVKERLATLRDSNVVPSNDDILFVEEAVNRLAEEEYDEGYSAASADTPDSYEEGFDAGYEEGYAEGLSDAEDTNTN